MAAVTLNLLAFYHLRYRLTVILCWNWYLTRKERQISNDMFCRCVKSTLVFKGIRVSDYIQNTDSLLGFLPTSASNGVLLKSARFILLRCGQSRHDVPFIRLWVIVPVGEGIRPLDF